MLYLMSHSDWEEYNPTLLEGPEVPNWEEYCASFIPIATNRILEKKSVERYARLISWSDLVDEVVLILVENGYTIVRPPETNWCGGVIDRHEERYATPGEGILPGDVFEKIKRHNKTNCRHFGDDEDEDCEEDCEPKVNPITEVVNSMDLPKAEDLLE